MMTFEEIRAEENWITSENLIAELSRLGESAIAEGRDYGTIVVFVDSQTIFRIPTHNWYMAQVFIVKDGEWTRPADILDRILWIPNLDNISFSDFPAMAQRWHSIAHKVRAKNNGHPVILIKGYSIAEKVKNFFGF